ncbi:GEM-like protein 4 [Cucumis melo var. makuwa]|uniref:GEM-like protein 4 n=1 Tax=Cucumis melo var. makuwa TaxID=1194695 RepID=A0A5A7SUE9_CUCMM|nr:GEM-like protein 4 [Cucumis melo var. makuwa]
MKTTIQEHMLGFQMSLALSRARYLGHPLKRLHLSSSDDGSQSSIKKYNGKDCILNRLNTNGKRTDNIIHALREHVKLGGKISEAVKGKLSLGAKILRVGGLRKIYKKLFSMNEEEKLLKVSQCYLSTTAGPLAGLLFISTHKIAFCSDKSIKIASPNGDHIRILYKVVIPKEKVMRVNETIEDKEQKQQIESSHRKKFIEGRRSLVDQFSEKVL